MSLLRAVGDVRGATALLGDLPADRRVSVARLAGRAAGRAVLGRLAAAVRAECAAAVAAAGRLAAAADGGAESESLPPWPRCRHGDGVQ